MLGKQFRDDQFIWLMQWVYCRIPKVKEDKVRRNLVGARSLEGLGALGRLGLEDLLLFMYPNLEGGRKVFRQILRFPLQ